MAETRQRGRGVLAIVAAAALLQSCTPAVETRGVLPDATTVAELKPGVSQRDDVTRILGTPSATATFDKETWYYIGEKTEAIAFFKPEVLEHKVLIVRFNKDGVLEDLRQVDATKQGKDVDLVLRETPTKGKELTIIQQLIGNVGRFNKPGEGPGD